MIRLLSAFAIGAGVAAILFGIVVDERFMWVWITAIVLLSVALPLYLVGRTMGSLATASPKLVAEARTAGRIAAARVDAIRRTGTTINDQPVCELDLSIAPSDRSPYRTTIRQLIDLVDLPRLQPGAAVAVARLRADAPDVALVGDRPDDLEARVSRLPSRDRMGDWQAGPVILGAEPPKAHRTGPLIGIGRKGRGWRLAAYAALFAAGAAAVLLPASADVERAVAEIATGEDRTSFFAEGRLDTAIAAIADAAGTDESVGVDVYGEYVIADMATSDGATTFDTWTFRDGAATRDGAAPVQPTDPELERFHLDEVAWGAFPALVERAVELADVDRHDLTSGPYAFVERGWPMDDVREPLVVRVSFGDDYTSHSFDATADGRLHDDVLAAGPKATGVAKPDEDLLASGLPLAIQRLVAVGASDETTGVTVFTTGIDTSLATSPGAETFDDYSYAERRATADGSGSMAIDPAHEVFRLGDVPWERVPELLADAYSRAGMEPGGDVDPYLIVDRSPFWGDAYPVTMLFYLPGAYETTVVEYGVDGAFLDLF